jgi:hypothetical protein
MCDAEFNPTSETKLAFALQLCEGHHPELLNS